MTPVSEFAHRRLAAISKTLIQVAGTDDWLQSHLDRYADRLHIELMRIIREEEQERGAALAQRIADGQCAVLGDTCLAHNEPYDAGHSYRYNGGTLD